MPTLRRPGYTIRYLPTNSRVDLKVIRERGWGYKVWLERERDLAGDIYEVD